MRRWLLALAACAASREPPVKSVQLNAPGMPVDVERALIEDHVTIVDFWSESCAACTIVTGMIAVQIANEPQIVVRKVDVGDGFTAVARAYQVSTLPHIKIYDRKRRLRYILIANECLRAPTLARELVRER